MNRINQEFRGLVISEREHNGYNDSDWSVVVWNPEDCKPEFHYYATTRGPFTEHNNPTAKADAMPAVEIAYGRFIYNLDRAKVAQDASAALKRAHVGAIVRVAKGRKVAKGLVGKVMSISKPVVVHSNYSSQTTVTKAMVDFGNKYDFVNVDNLEVLQSTPALNQLAFDLAT